MSWFSDGLAWGVDTLADAAGETVTLSRASDTTEITAVAVNSGDNASGRNWSPTQADMRGL